MRIDAGALGPDLPNRPLTVTADHALLFGDMLVNAGTLPADGLRGLPAIARRPLVAAPRKTGAWRRDAARARSSLAPASGCGKAP